MSAPSSASATAIRPTRRRLRILRRPTESIRPAMPRPERRDGHGRLARALLEMAGAGAALTDAGFRPWCSATFLGAQHRFTLRIPGADAAARAATLARALPEAEFAIAGHVVADVTVDRLRVDAEGARLMDVAALTIEDW